MPHMLFAEATCLENIYESTKCGQNQRTEYEEENDTTNLLHFFSSLETGNEKVSSCEHA